MKALSLQRFEALIGYTRVPYILDYTEEVYAYSDDGEKIIVLISFDLTDEDFNAILTLE